MSPSPHEIVALVVAVGFAAGLNVYGTVATLGLLERFHALHLPANLHMLQDWWVIGVASALFVLEMFADKIPYFDLVWNALHTFIRVPVAAVLGYAASAHLGPQWQALGAVAASGVALAAHTGKTAVRVGVTPSPEPVSNIALSTGEDVLAIFLTWFASQHPYLAALLAIILVVLLILAIRWILRKLGMMWRRLMQGRNASAAAQP